MSAMNWLSPIQLLDSVILGANLSVNHDYDGDNPSGVKFTLNTSFDDIEEADGRWLCRGMVEVLQTVTDDDDADQVVFLVSCSLGVLVGLDKKSLPAEVDMSELRAALEVNALSLGYGKLRYYVEDFTSQSVVGRVTLPTVDANEYMKLVAENRAAAKEGSQ